jgi:hypothetical protein
LGAFGNEEFGFPKREHSSHQRTKPRHHHHHHHPPPNPLTGFLALGFFSSSSSEDDPEESEDESESESEESESEEDPLPELEPSDSDSDSDSSDSSSSSSFFPSSPMYPEGSCEGGIGGRGSDAGDSGNIVDMDWGKL